MSTVVVATGFGGPEVLSVIDEPVGEPGPGQIRLQVRAAAVNPFDHKQYSGAFGTDPAQLPIRPGLEVSGVVAAVGEGAIGPSGPLSVGDEVLAYPVHGGYAAELLVTADAVSPKPPSLSWQAAAGLLITGSTAAHCLHAVDLRSGDTVLVHGAAGGVGLFVVQLAVQRGATVVATASPARHEALRAIGAIPVAYGDGLIDRVRAAAPQGVDAALDLVGTDEAIDTSLELVADRARIATVTAFDRANQDGFSSLGGGPGADPGTEVRRAARAGLIAAAAAGDLQVPIDRTYPLAEAADAHRLSIEGHATGKIILVP